MNQHLEQLSKQIEYFLLTDQQYTFEQRQMAVKDLLAEEGFPVIGNC